MWNHDSNGTGMGTGMRAAVLGIAMCAGTASMAIDGVYSHGEMHAVASENGIENAMGADAMTDEVSKNVLGYEIEMIDGSMQSLESFKGKVVLMVNVASKCGLTPQYKGLEAMYQEHKDDGLVIIGFPANEFGGQEPGTDEEIATFCEKNYGVSFPMASKIVVKGEGIHPLYAQLTAQPEPVGGEIEWNFDKFFVNRAGEVVGRFKPRTEPGDTALVEMLRALLAES